MIQSIELLRKKFCSEEANGEEYFDELDDRSLVVVMYNHYYCNILQKIGKLSIILQKFFHPIFSCAQFLTLSWPEPPYRMA